MAERLTEQSKDYPRWYTEVVQRGDLADYAIEVDLQLTADGEAVVFHDYTLDRLTDARGQVCERTVAELKQIAFKSSGDRIQTLGELLEQVDGRVEVLAGLKAGSRTVVASVASARCRVKRP